MKPTRVEDVVRRFNDAINRRDLGGLGELMTEDHTLRAGTDAPVCGKRACLRAWGRFFDLFPDYWNVFEEVRSEHERAWIRGYSTCTDARLRGPALWTATIVDRRVREWCVYEDTPENRTKVGLGPS